MPINWNEIDEHKLEYIQNKEALKAEYERKYLACLDKKHNQSFLAKIFNSAKEPELQEPDNYTLPLYKNYFYYRNDKNTIIIANLLSLPSELNNNVMKYLNPTAKIYLANNNWNREEFLCIDDTDENRKKIDKVVTLIEKYLDNEKAAQEARQKEAEAFIDNYINSKKGK